MNFKIPIYKMKNMCYYIRNYTFEGNFMDNNNYTQGDIVISQQPIPDNSFEYIPSSVANSYQASSPSPSGNAPKRQNDGGSSKSILIAILAVGVCLLVVSIAGMVGAGMKPSSDSNIPVETTTAAPVVADPNAVVQTTVPQQVQTTAPQQQEQQNTPQGTETPAGTNTAAPQSDAEWLEFFNNSLNKLKTDGPALTKSKRTQTADIKLSNTLAQAYVSAAKDQYLSDETVKTPVPKGDVATAKTVISPDGAAYVSTLTMSDIKSITHTTDANGNYVIRIDMPDATNPEESGAYGRVFEFMLVDEVMTTYAPNMGATVDRANVFLNYSGCYAEATISPDGKVVKYYTKVNANMVLKDAKVKIVNTNLDVILYSDTEYTDIQW